MQVLIPGLYTGKREPQHQGYTILSCLQMVCLQQPVQLTLVFVRNSKSPFQMSKGITIWGEDYRFTKGMMNPESPCERHGKHVNVLPLLLHAHI